MTHSIFSPPLPNKTLKTKKATQKFRKKKENIAKQKNTKLQLIVRL
jgi:hypothetical protein